MMTPKQIELARKLETHDKWAAVTAEQHRIVTGSELQPTVVVDLDTLEHSPDCQWFIATADSRDSYAEEVVRRVVAGRKVLHGRGLRGVA